MALSRRRRRSLPPAHGHSLVLARAVQLPVLRLRLVAVAVQAARPLAHYPCALLHAPEWARQERLRPPAFVHQIDSDAPGVATLPRKSLPPQPVPLEQLLPELYPLQEREPVQQRAVRRLHFLSEARPPRAAGHVHDAAYGCAMQVVKVPKHDAPPCPRLWPRTCTPAPPSYQRS